MGYSYSVYDGMHIIVMVLLYLGDSRSRAGISLFGVQACPAVARGLHGLHGRPAA